MRLKHNTLSDPHINQLIDVFLVHQANVLGPNKHIHNTYSTNVHWYWSKTKTLACDFSIIVDIYLARSTALRSFFAQSAIRGSTRATLQLRSICKVEAKVKMTHSKRDKKMQVIKWTYYSTVLMQLSADSAITSTVITTSLKRTWLSDQKLIISKASKLW